MKCLSCQQHDAEYTVKARVPSTQTSRLGNKSFQGNACGACLEGVVIAAMHKISWTAPAKVSLVDTP